MAEYVVKTCWNCPFICGDEHGQWGCAHVGEVDHTSAPPDSCPLRTADISIRLANSEPVKRKTLTSAERNAALEHARMNGLEFEGIHVSGWATVAVYESMPSVSDAPMPDMFVATSTPARVREGLNRAAREMLARFGLIELDRDVWRAVEIIDGPA